jgi:hypothetical protein
LHALNGKKSPVFRFALIKREMSQSFRRAINNEGPVR